MSQQVPMKTAILTANIGGIDEMHAPPKQTVDYDFFYYTENTLPFPLPSLDNRMKGKYLKTQSHKILDHNIFIWIDGCVKVLDGTFIAWALREIEGYDIILCKHFDRDNVYDEIDCIVDNMRQGSNYLIERYGNQPFDKEKQFYHEQGMPKEYPLYNGWFFVRRNNERMNKVFDRWWDMVLRFTNFDQTQLAFVLWESGIKAKVVDVTDYLTREKHK